MLDSDRAVAVFLVTGQFGVFFGVGVGVGIGIGIGIAFITVNRTLRTNQDHVGTAIPGSSYETFTFTR